MKEQSEIFGFSEQPWRWADQRGHVPMPPTRGGAAQCF
jgi:hypothetical protein